MTVGGRSRPATPSVRFSPRRSRFMSSAGPYPCFCATSSGGIAGSIVSAPGLTLYDVEPICGNDIVQTVTIDATWFTGTPSGGEIRLDAHIDSWAVPPDTSIIAWIDIRNSGNDMGWSMIGTPGIFSQVDITEPVSNIPARPTHGDVLELHVTGLMTATATAEMIWRGGTLFSESWSTAETNYETMAAHLGLSNTSATDWTVDTAC